MNNEKADYILVSRKIFDGTGSEAFGGFVGLKKNKIYKIGRNHKYEELIGPDTKIIQLEDQVICPGFTDVHTFFTGYVIFHIGATLVNISTKEKCLEVLKNYSISLKEEATIFGHGWEPERFPLIGLEEELNIRYPSRAVVLFSAGRDTCIMNQCARNTYNFTPETCYPESYYKIMREYLNDKKFIDKEWKEYMLLMNSKGVTSVKEMGFDDYYGFTDFLSEWENKKALTIRVSFMSQPNGEPINIPYGLKMKEKFKGEFITFSGYNRMVDGTIASGKGDLIEPYEGTKIHCYEEIDYKKIQEEVLLADENGFRYSLHAQGDKAVRSILDIYEQCQLEDGKCTNRHAVTDLEFTHLEDLERMGRLGVIAEIYPQIMSLDAGEIVLSNINRTIGQDRKRYYWNRKAMLNNNVPVSCGTDLPLMITDIPQSIYHACGGYFPEGGEPFNQENTMTIEELLKSWTLVGQYNLGKEEILGTLEEGKIADIAVLNENVFNWNINEMKKVEVSLTFCDGKIVYRKET